MVNIVPGVGLEPTRPYELQILIGFGFLDTACDLYWKNKKKLGQRGSKSHNTLSIALGW